MGPLNLTSKAKYDTIKIRDQRDEKDVMSLRVRVAYECYIILVREVVKLRQLGPLSSSLLNFPPSVTFLREQHVRESGQRCNFAWLGLRRRPMCRQNRFLSFSATTTLLVTNELPPADRCKIELSDVADCVPDLSIAGLEPGVIQRNLIAG